MAKNDNLKDFLVDIADAIRSAKNSDEVINAQDFSTEIRNLSASKLDPVLMFEYIGMDKNGNLETSADFDGTIVEYAVGGFNSEYFGGYNFDTKIDANTKSIVPYEIAIPYMYNGKFVTKITSGAFEGYHIDSNYNYHTQYAFLHKISIPPSIKEYTYSCFTGCGSFYADTNKDDGLKINSTDKTKAIIYGENIFFNNRTFGHTSINKIEFNVSTTLNLDDMVSTYGFNQIMSNKITKITGYFQIDSTNKKLVFKHSNEDTIDLSGLTNQKNAMQIDIYTDNDYIRNFNWSSKNYTPTFYSLNEYVG